MNSTTTMAISRAISGTSKDAKAARETLTVGEHEVNVVVHLQGKLKVEEDQEIASTASLLSEDFLALVLHHAGITREHALKVIEDVAGNYLADWTGSKEDKKAAKAARAAKVAEFDPEGRMSAVFDAFKARLPKTPRKGAVSFVGKVEEMELPVVLKAVENVA